MINENDELILEDDGNLYWQITTEDESLKMLKMRPRIGQVEEEFVDVVQDALKELKRLRGKNRSMLLRLYELQGQLNTLHRGEEE